MWAISTTNCNLARFSPTCFARRKLREISICGRNCSQGSCSYFDFPLSCWNTNLREACENQARYPLCLAGGFRRNSRRNALWSHHNNRQQARSKNARKIKSVSRRFHGQNSMLAKLIDIWVKINFCWLCIKNLKIT